MLKNVKLIYHINKIIDHQRLYILSIFIKKKLNLFTKMII